VAFARNTVRLEASHIGPEFDDFKRIFVAHGHRREDRLLRLRVSTEDTDVGVADARLAHVRQPVVGANRGLLLGDERLNILAGLLLSQPHAR
jgi:hypothetical protein